jgi:hypothetical protein
VVDCRQYQSVAIDRVGITVLRDITFLAAGDSGFLRVQSSLARAAQVNLGRFSR